MVQVVVKVIGRGKEMVSNGQWGQLSFIKKSLVWDILCCVTKFNDVIFKAILLWIHIVLLKWVKHCLSSIFDGA